jgi:putative transposase
MKTKDEYLADFEAEGMYHVFNRTNNKELLFHSDLDKQLFLDRYNHYLDPFLETFTWMLIPNHFHFIVRVKPIDKIIKHLQGLKPDVLKKVEKDFLVSEETVEHLLELEWTRFLTSYAMRFNLNHGRSGNLFNRPFKRLLVEDDEYFRQVMLYIHTNPCKHHITSDIEHYEWSSYGYLLKSDLTSPVHKEIMFKFGGIESFISSHKLKLESLIGATVS